MAGLKDCRTGRIQREAFRPFYPALLRLEQKGWIASDWGTSENNRRARFYSLTTMGRKQVTLETGRWNRLVQSIARVIDASPTPEEA